MNYDGNLGIKIFALFLTAYVTGAVIVGAIRYCWGSKLGLASLGLGLALVVGLAVFLAGPIERRSISSWLAGVGEVALIFGVSWLVVGFLGLLGGAFVRRAIAKRNLR